MYEFAEDTGSMERSWYFVSLQKDLYHFDHFMGTCMIVCGNLEKQCVAVRLHKHGCMRYVNAHATLCVHTL